MMKSSKKNLGIAVLLFVVALVACAVWWFFAHSASAAYAVVHTSDGSETRLPLDQDTTVTFTTDKGTNVVVVKDGEVFVQQADCPHQDCVNQGRISSSASQIVCLPHELWIEIKGADADLDVTSR